MPTFNILIATIGKPQLQRMLDSLSPQLEESDCLTIVYDGHSIEPEFNLKNFKCKVITHCEPTALGYWGHGIRNKYAPLLEHRDFIMHADDDDKYYDHVFSKLRLLCLDKSMLYIGLMNFYGKAMPITKTIKENEIGTPCGIIPYTLNTKGYWKERYGGDGQFYLGLAELCEPEYLDVLMYWIRPRS
jgi:hypothetical protein